MSYTCVKRFMLIHKKKTVKD